MDEIKELSVWIVLFAFEEKNRKQGNAQCISFFKVV